MELSIVVTSWNTRDLMRGLLVSLRIHAPSVAHEIIVVDNASGDGTVEMIESEFPEVTLIRNTKNVGFAAGNNLGVERAMGAFLLLLGSDTIVHVRSIEVMYEYLAAHPDVGGAACRLLNPDGSHQLSVRRFPRLRDAVLTYSGLHRWTSRYTMRGFDFSATSEVEQPAATCLMLRGSAVTHPLFDERYTILYNDVDLCYRMRERGWRIVYLGSTAITHVGCSSTSQAGSDLRLEMYRNILLYYRLHAGRHAGWILKPLLALRLCLATRSAGGLRLLFGKRTIS